MLSNSPFEPLHNSSTVLMLKSDDVAGHPNRTDFAKCSASSQCVGRTEHYVWLM